MTSLKFSYNLLIISYWVFEIFSVENRKQNWGKQLNLEITCRLTLVSALFCVCVWAWSCPILTAFKLFTVTFPEQTLKCSVIFLPYVSYLFQLLVRKWKIHIYFWNFTVQLRIVKRCSCKGKIPLSQAKF